MGKLFVFVASLHLIVFGALLVLSGCQHSNQDDQKLAHLHEAPSPLGNSSVETVPVEPPRRSAPMRPDWELVEVQVISEQTINSLEPLQPLPVEAELLIPSGTTYTVQKGDSLWSISQRFGIGMDTLAAANQLSKNSTLKIGQQLFIPSDLKISNTIATPSQEMGAIEAQNQAYTVRRGDSLSKIAKRYGTTVGALRALNHLKTDNILVGQTLLIPNGTKNSADTQVQAEIVPLQNPQSYTVRAGDTLSLIAARSGVKVSDLMAWNNIKNPRALKVGQILKLPANTHLEAIPATSEAPAVQLAIPQSEAAPEITIIEVDTVSASLPEGFGDDSAFDAVEATEVIPLESTDTQ